MTDQDRINALPNWGQARPSPLHSQPPGIEDNRGFVAVLKIFLRTWPFLLPLVVGYWRDSPVIRWSGFTRYQASDWSYSYVRILVPALAAIGPLSGTLFFGLDWQHDLLFGAIICMTILAWVIPFLEKRHLKRRFVTTTGALVLLLVATNLFAVMVVAGWSDNVLVGLVSFGCLSIWVLQYRIAGEELQLRLRFGSHLVYYYVVVLLLVLLGIIGGLFTVDLLNQSILQAKPLTSFLAGFVNRPELAVGARETLDVAQRRDLQWIYMVFVVVIGVITVPLARVALPYYNIWILQQINQELRSALIERWHQLSLRYHGDHRVGDSVYRVYQDSAQVTAIVGLLISVSKELTQYAVLVVFIAALDPILGLLGLSLAITAILWSRWFAPRVRVRSRIAREANSNLTSRIQEVLGSVNVVKAYARESAEQARFEADSVGAFNAAFSVRSLVAVVGIMMFSIVASIILAGEFLMAVWASDNRETFAAVLIGLVGLSFVRWNLGAFQWAQAELTKSSEQVRGLVRNWSLAQDMAMGLDRVFEILDIEPDVVEAPDAIAMPAFEREIRFDHVGFAYQTDRPILRDVSFTVQPGSITAILGPTGCGKSTLVSLLIRLFDPDSGRISVDGVDLRDLELESLRANVSIALQENVLFGMSIRDNIRYVVPTASDDDVMRAAYVACADEYINGLPDGLDTLLGDRGGRLSTGQRQRVSIARALVKDAPVLILDEPTAALDAQTEHRVLERLSEWGAGRAIFLITHRISTIERADQILYLDRGEILERGNHAALMALTGGHYRSFVETERSLATGRDLRAGDPS